jgi:hypothetical protein
MKEPNPTNISLTNVICSPDKKDRSSCNCGQYFYCCFQKLRCHRGYLFCVIKQLVKHAPLLFQKKTYNEYVATQTPCDHIIVTLHLSKALSNLFNSKNKSCERLALMTPHTCCRLFLSKGGACSTNCVIPIASYQLQPPPGIEICGSVNCFVLFYFYQLQRLCSPGTTLHTPWTTIHTPWTTLHRPWTTIHRPWTTIHRPWTTISQAMDHNSQAMDHNSQAMDHNSQAMDHNSHTMDHNTQAMDYNSQAMDHNSQAMDHNFTGHGP